MKLETFATLALIALLSITLTQSKNATDPPGPPRSYPPLPTRHSIFENYPRPEPDCGGTLTDPKSGISYKPFFSVTPNERCVWFIQAGNATVYDMEIFINNDCVRPNPNKLVISTLRHGHNATHHYPNVDTKLILDAEVIMVTFYTPHNSTSSCKGFILRYTAKDGSPPAIGQPHHYKLQEGTAMSYPNSLGAPAYSNYELTCFLFGPDDFKYHAEKMNKVCYHRNGLEGDSCYDHVTLYRFNAYTMWQVMYRICGEVSTSQIRNDDLILAVFESDDSGTGAGFELSYNTRDC